MRLRTTLIAALCRPSASFLCGNIPCAWAPRSLLAAAPRRTLVACSTESSQPDEAQLPARPTFKAAVRPHPATLTGDDLRKECSVKHTRSSGPGGQHRNKVNTAVVLTHGPTEVTASATEERSQSRNAAKALTRLRVRLALQLRSEPPPTEPSTLWTTRTRGGKVSVSEGHADFPAVLAEALDWIVALDDVKAASVALGVSQSQMIKFLAKEPVALEVVNRLRASKGLGPLRSR